MTAIGSTLIVLALFINAGNPPYREPGNFSTSCFIIGCFMVIVGIIK